MSQTSIKVQILNTEELIFDGEVDRISSFNEMGAFDVYPMHANFISIIHKQLALYHKHQKVKEMDFEQAVMKVKKDSVSIFLGMEVLHIDEEWIIKFLPKIRPKIPKNSTSTILRQLLKTIYHFLPSAIAFGLSNQSKLSLRE